VTENTILAGSAAQVTWIGVDAGATKALAVAVTRGRGGAVHVVARSRRMPYPRVHGFRPVPLERQLEEAAAQRARLTDAERQQGHAIVGTVGRAIARVLRTGVPARIGFCLAGLKTDDGAGVSVWANGPRMPSFAAELCHELDRLGIARPHMALPLSSDGYCSGLGEDAGPRGRLRSVRNAYYAGAGTGVAEALKLEGRVIPLDEAAQWFPKAWQIPWASGGTAEGAVSAHGLMRRYESRSGRSSLSTARPARPLTEAVRGDAWAQQVVRAWADDWARFAAHRIALWRRGNPDRPLQRFVVGQRAGEALARHDLAPFFKLPFEARLTALLRAMKASEFLCVRRRGLRRGFVTPSRWMEAPAVGAAVLAMGEQ
jgi:hypothetical protein